MMKKILTTLSFVLFTASMAFALGFSNQPEINYAANAAIQLQRAGTYESGIFDEGAAEIAAYDALSQKLFVTNANANTVDVECYQ